MRHTKTITCAAHETVKRLVERDGDVVLVEWEGFVDPGSYTWESVSDLQNDLDIDVFTNFLDALPQVEVEGVRDLQEVSTFAGGPYRNIHYTTT